MSFVNISGKKFGRLTAISYNKDTRKWLCRCECGREKEVSYGHLIDGHTKSCGCLNSQMTSERNYKHGLYGTRIYRIYYGILQRCCIERNPAYKDYGGRGIGICDEWKKDFLAFYDWAIANGYSDSLSIDRIDNDKGYSPDNCQWVSQKQQCNNRRCNIMVGSKTLKQVCEERGLKYHTVYARIRRGERAEAAIEVVSA